METCVIANKNTQSIQNISKIIPVILCGGSGSRLWPVSREQHPKPFMRPLGQSSLLQKAFLLGADFPGVSEIFIVTNKNFLFKIQDEILEANRKSIGLSFIIEPTARNTAAAIACAAIQIASVYGKDALMLVLTADHVIDDKDAFQQAVEEGVGLAQLGKIVTFGIRPDGPNTGYGYIKFDGKQVVQFIEKPSLDKAEEYVASGQFLWNSGLFFFRSGSMLDAMDEHAPDIFTAANVCINQSTVCQSKQGLELVLDVTSFSDIPMRSIDCAIMEKSNQVAVIPCDMKWADVGSWSAFEQLIDPDEKGNRIEGDVLLQDVSNCYINSDNRLVAAVGVENLLIVDTPDALLVADKSCDQEVKKLYLKLKQTGHDTHKLHRTVHRPWGSYTILECSAHCKIKRLEVKPGGSLSLQMHYHRSEHWVVVSGIAKVVNDMMEFFVRVNESTYIKAGCKHRIENPGSLHLIMIEVQTGDYLGEDDIVRYEDVYGRV